MSEVIHGSRSARSIATASSATIDRGQSLAPARSRGNRLTARCSAADVVCRRAAKCQDLSMDIDKISGDREITAPEPTPARQEIPMSDLNDSLDDLIGGAFVDPKAAAEAYGIETGTCCICKR